MQTIYYSTTNFIQHRGNLVDLDEFRWKLARARGEAGTGGVGDRGAEA